MATAKSQEHVVKGAPSDTNGSVTRKYSGAFYTSLKQVAYEGPLLCKYAKLGYKSRFCKLKGDSLQFFGNEEAAKSGNQFEGPFCLKKIRSWEDVFCDSFKRGIVIDVKKHDVDVSEVIALRFCTIDEKDCWEKILKVAVKLTSCTSVSGDQYVEVNDFSNHSETEGEEGENEEEDEDEDDNAESSVISSTNSDWESPDLLLRPSERDGIAFVVFQVNGVDLTRFEECCLYQPYTFNSGDAYVVLHCEDVTGPPGVINKNIYYWIGKKAGSDKASVASIKSIELRHTLIGKCFIHREDEGEESPEFLVLFDGELGIEENECSGMSILRPTLFIQHLPPIMYTLQLPSENQKLIGSTSSCIQRRMGIQHSFHMNRIAFSINQLRDDSVVIVDDRNCNIYVWQGKCASFDLKRCAMEGATCLKGDIPKGAKVLVIDQGLESSDWNRLFASENFTNGKIDDCHFTMLVRITCSSDNTSQIEKCADGSTPSQSIIANGTRRSRLEMSLVCCSNISNAVEIIGEELETEEDDFIPSLNMVIGHNDAAFILDCGTEMFVWHGSKSPRAVRIGAIKVAGQLIKSYKNRPSWATEVTHVLEGKEPFLFRVKFLDWGAALRGHQFRSMPFFFYRSVRTICSADTEENEEMIANRIASFISDNAKLEIESEEDAVLRDLGIDNDSGHGQVLVWRITSQNENGVCLVDDDHVGNFLSSCSYVFLYGYSEATNHKDRNDMCASQCSELKYSSYHSSNMHSRDPYDYERRKRRASAASSCSVMSTSSYESGLYTVHFSEVKARSVLEEFSSEKSTSSSDSEGFELNNSIHKEKVLNQVSRRASCECGFESIDEQSYLSKEDADSIIGARKVSSAMLDSFIEDDQSYTELLRLSSTESFADPRQNRTNNKGKYIVYYWQGSRAHKSDWIRWCKVGCPYLMPQWKRTLGDVEVLRVYQGKEPAHLRRIFSGSGKDDKSICIHEPGWRKVINPDWRISLFKLYEMPGGTVQAFQVPSSVSSFSSRHNFICLRSTRLDSVVHETQHSAFTHSDSQSSPTNKRNETAWYWQGSCASPLLQNGSASILNSLVQYNNLPLNANMVILNENDILNGCEDDAISDWTDLVENCLGQSVSDSYASFSIDENMDILPDQYVHPRLYLLDTSSIKIMLRPLAFIQQSCLLESTGCIGLLDAPEAVYVWKGKTANLRLFHIVWQAGLRYGKRKGRECALAQFRSSLPDKLINDCRGDSIPDFEAMLSALAPNLSSIVLAASARYGTVISVMHGKEPLQFKAHFQTWEDNLGVDYIDIYEKRLSNRADRDELGDAKYLRGRVLSDEGARMHWTRQLEQDIDKSNHSTTGSGLKRSSHTQVQDQAISFYASDLNSNIVSRSSFYGNLSMRGSKHKMTAKVNELFLQAVLDEPSIDDKIKKRLEQPISPCAAAMRRRNMLNSVHEPVHIRQKADVHFEFADYDRELANAFHEVDMEGRVHTDYLSQVCDRCSLPYTTINEDDDYDCHKELPSERKLSLTSAMARIKKETKQNVDVLGRDQKLTKSEQLLPESSLKPEKKFLKHDNIITDFMHRLGYHPKEKTAHLKRKSFKDILF